MGIREKEYEPGDLAAFERAIADSVSLADIARHRNRNRSALRLECYGVGMFQKIERLIAAREFEIRA